MYFRSSDPEDSSQCRDLRRWNGHNQIGILRTVVMEVACRPVMIRLSYGYLYDREFHNVLFTVIFTKTKISIYYIMNLDFS